ncbi:hypothetical protein LMIY3S_01996 [Labrys miyagiensis]
MDEDPNRIKVRIGRRRGFEASASGRFGIGAVVLLGVTYLALISLGFGRVFGWW